MSFSHVLCSTTPRLGLCFASILAHTLSLSSRLAHTAPPLSPPPHPTRPTCTSHSKSSSSSSTYLLRQSPAHPSLALRPHLQSRGRAQQDVPLWRRADGRGSGRGRRRRRRTRGSACGCGRRCCTCCVCVCVCCCSCVSEHELFSGDETVSAFARQGDARFLNVHVTHLHTYTSQSL